MLAQRKTSFDRRQGHFGKYQKSSRIINDIPLRNFLHFFVDRFRKPIYDILKNGKMHILPRYFTKGERKRMKKTLTILLIALLAVSSVFAQGGNESAGKTEVYFLNFKPEIADVYTSVVEPAFEAAYPQYDLKVVTAASNQYQQTLRSELTKSAPPTIFQVNGPVGIAENVTTVAPLQDTDFYNLLADKGMALSLDGNVVAVPYAVEGYGIIYNDAIMRKYFALPDKAVSISSAEEITDFETLKAVVEDMSKHLDELGIQGVFAATSFAPGSEWRWTTHLVNPAIWAEFGDLATAQEAATFEFQATENFKNLFDLYLNNSATSKGLVGSMADADSMAQFALGQCAMVQNGNWAAAQILGTQGNVVSDEDIKFLPLYMGLDGEENYGICIGTENYLAFNKNASAEALEGADTFLTWLYSSEEGKQIVTKDLMFITPFSSFSPEEVPNDPLARQVNIWMNKDGVSSIPWVFGGIPSEQWKADFAQAMLEYINGNYTWDQVTQTAIEAWAREASLTGR